MKPETKVLVVIGARSGSKGIADKNIKPLLGKPLLVWVAEAAQKSQHVTRVIVSTDSREYADCARGYGIEVPFLRPKELSGDLVPDFDYLYHAVSWLEEHEQWRADVILRVPPTSPLCTTEHIDACIELLLHDKEADSSRTIVPATKHPYKLWRAEGEYIVPFLSEEYTGLKDAHNLPRQSFPEAFQHVDVIALRYKTLMEDKTMAGHRVRYHRIPKHEAIDIDNEYDFLLAELLLQKRLNKEREDTSF